MPKNHEDDNDRLRKGTLPNSPAAGTVPMPKPQPGSGAEQTPTVEVHRWPSLLPQAFHGPLGEAAQAIEPMTEADQAAILVQLIVAFGNAVGRGPRVVMGSVRQWTNLYVVIVGKSSKARKGTSWSNAREVIADADRDWSTARIKSGLSSGEGVIHAVRDPLIIQEAVREAGRKGGKVIEYQDVEQDPGVEDKRLLVVEAEFARALKVAARKESTLSTILREAWDSGNLGTLTRSPYGATGAHISIVGHITRDELRRELSASDAINGFANRFLWCCAKRSKELPFGEGRIEDAAAGPRGRIATAIRLARARGQDFVISMDRACRRQWCEEYSRLSADRTGLAGCALNRAEAQVLRLALVYALADQAEAIGTDHLQAALALWRYMEESAHYIFGDSLGDPIADEILRVLRETPEGMTRDDIRNHFDRNVPAARLTQALGVLAEQGLAVGAKEQAQGGHGRPAERWRSCPGRDAVNAINADNPPGSGTNSVNGVNGVHGRHKMELPGDGGLGDGGDELPGQALS